jgi:hypothetical protein
MRVLLSPPGDTDLRSRLAGRSNAAQLVSAAGAEALDAIARPGLWEAVLEPMARKDAVYRFRGLLAGFVKVADAVATRG